MKSITRKKIVSELQLAIQGVLSKYGKISPEQIGKSIKKSDKEIAKRFVKIAKKEILINADADKTIAKRNAKTPAKSNKKVKVSNR